MFENTKTIRFQYTTEEYERTNEVDEGKMKKILNNTATFGRIDDGKFRIDFFVIE